MDRSLLGLQALIASVTAGLSSGCVVQTVDDLIPEPQLPIKVHAQDTWSAEPDYGTDGVVRQSARKIIADAVQQWNDAVAPRLAPGQPPPLTFEGFVDVPDFDAADPKTALTDGRSVIYKVTETTPELRAMLDAGGYPDLVVGYGLPDGDALIMLDQFDAWIGDDKKPDSRTELLSQTVCHELGHVLGIQHYENKDGVMNPDIAWYTRDAHGRYVKDADVEAFCLVHPDACQH
jgi:hypothetical protein